MRLFYQIYYDGSWLSASTKAKLISILSEGVLIESLEKDSNQFIIRYRYPDNKGSEELKIGNNFIQVSSEISFEKCKETFDKLQKIIKNEDIEVPF